MLAPYSHLISWGWNFMKNQKPIIYLKRMMNDLYAFVNVHGWYYNLVNLLTIEDKLDVMRIMFKLGSYM